MREGKIGCLPVIDAGKLVGIVSAHDLLSLVEQL
jgi:CBS domain-containing protein